MEFSKEKRLEELGHILNGPDYFTCTRLACKLRVTVCVQRQERNDNGFSFNETVFPECLNCAQGNQNKLFQKEGESMVGDLELTKRVKEGEENKTPQSESPRLCACGKKTLSPNCPYCPSCMSTKSRAAKNPKGGIEGPQSVELSDQQDEKIIRSTVIAAPPQIEPDLNLMINFDSYVQILDEVKRMAKMEIRPVDLQVIYMLKKFIDGNPYPSE